MHFQKNKNIIYLNINGVKIEYENIPEIFNKIFSILIKYSFNIKLL
jgi:hypothetical protein